MLRQQEQELLKLVLVCFGHGFVGISDVMLC